MSLSTRARLLARSAAIFACAAAQMRCASTEDALPRAEDPDGATDAGLLDAAADVADAGLRTACTESFCRVPFSSSEVIALNGLWANSRSDVWVVGSSGYAAHFDDDEWRPVVTGTKHALFAVTATADGTVWAASSGEGFYILNRSSDGSATGVDGGFKGIVTAISASGSDVYAVGIAVTGFGGPGLDNIWRYRAGDDAQWVPVSPPCPTDWSMLPRCAKLRAVWAESRTRQWFAGDDGRVYRTRPPTEDEEDGGTYRLYLAEVSSSSLRRIDALWGFGENDIWAVGAQGVIRHWEGDEAWSVIASPVTADLHGVWGPAPDDVWAVGDDGVVIHWDGQAWSEVDTPFGEDNRPRLRAVSGTGRDVWIAGDNTLLRSRGGMGERP